MVLWTLIFQGISISDAEIRRGFITVSARNPVYDGSVAVFCSL